MVAVSAPALSPRNIYWTERPADTRRNKSPVCAKVRHREAAFKDDAHPCPDQLILEALCGATRRRVGAAADESAVRQRDAAFHEVLEIGVKRQREPVLRRTRTKPDAGRARALDSFDLILAARRGGVRASLIRVC